MNPKSIARSMDRSFSATGADLVQSHPPNVNHRNMPQKYVQMSNSKPWFQAGCAKYQREFRDMSWLCHLHIRCWLVV